MASKLVCDWCGCEIDTRNVLGRNDPSRYVIKLYNNIEYGYYTYRMCPSCHEKIFENREDLFKDKEQKEMKWGVQKTNEFADIIRKIIFEDR